MATERTKILEMLSEGKITVEEATRLLDALAGSRGAGPDDTSRRDRRRRRSRRRGRSDPGSDDWQELEDELGVVEQEIQDRIEEARATLRASMPRIRRAVDHAMPDVDRAVKEATGAMPDIGRIVREAVRSAGSAISAASRNWRQEDYPHSAEGDETATGAFDPGDRLAIRNRMGHLEIETWDRSELDLQAHITVSARDRVQAAAFLERVTVRVDREPGVTRIQPSHPEREGEWDGIGPVRVDLRLKVPGQADLDLNTAHGGIRVPDIDGAAVLKCRHGHTTVRGVTGSLWVEQAHGNVSVGAAGSDLTLEARHGNVTIDSVGGSGKLNVQHGNLTVGGVANAVEISIAHGNLELRSVAEDAAVTSRHGKVDITSIAGSLDVKAAHGALSIASVSGDVRAVNGHASTRVADVAGDVVAQNGHASISVVNVAGSTTACTRHADLQLTRIAGAVTAESSHGAIRLEEIAGAVTASNSKGPIDITGVQDAVSVQNREGRTRIDPGSAIASPYAIQTVGEVELVVPEGSDADIAGHTRRGRVRSDWPMEIADDGRGGQTVKGRVGDGGISVAIENAKGDIVLRRGRNRGPGVGDRDDATGESDGGR